MAWRPINLYMLVYPHLSAHMCVCRQPDQPVPEEQQPTEQAQLAEHAPAEDGTSLEDMEQ